ncbi:MAG: tagatose-bisphosphate aldolase [Coriobacteriaceae bacterium]|nr:tagatose-bisphosphate aldolase [Coriobacteriaceae bacterium]
MATTFTKQISEEKRARLAATMDEDGVIAALAIDQRGAMKKLIGAFREPTDEDIVEFKKLVSRELTPYASSILLDPEYGLPASELRAKNAGLLVAYEKTGYDATVPGRLPDLLSVWSARRLKEAGADAVKFLLYFDPDEGDEINDQKRTFVERIGSECAAEEMPLFVEIVTYDAAGADPKGAEFASAKPKKVIESMREFSDPRYGVDVLKVEVPVNMAFVEGYTAEGVEPVYTAAEAAAAFKEQAEATDLPFIFLSAGVSAELFRETLRFAKEAGSTFNGVLCGRATWADGVKAFCEGGEDGAVAWLRDQGRKNVEELNEVLKETATPVSL